MSGPVEESDIPRNTISENDPILALANLQNSSIESAYIAKGLKDFSLQQKIDLAGIISLERYKVKGLANTYRNSPYFAKQIVLEIMADCEFPVKKEEMNDFYRLYQSAMEGNKDAEEKIREIYNNVPKEIIKTFLPVYHQVMDDAMKLKIDGETTEQRNKRIENAKTDISRHIGFPFFEIRAIDLLIKDGFSTELKKSINFHAEKLRKEGIMDGLLRSLEEENKNYSLPIIDDDTKKSLNPVITSRTNASKQYKNNQNSIVKPFIDKAESVSSVIYRLSNRLKGTQQEAKLNAYNDSISAWKGDLQGKIARVEGVTQEDINYASQILSEIASTVLNMPDKAVKKNLNKDHIKALVDAGAKSKPPKKKPSLFDRMMGKRSSSRKSAPTQRPKPQTPKVEIPKTVTPNKVSPEYKNKLFKLGRHRAATAGSSPTDVGTPPLGVFISSHRKPPKSVIHDEPVKSFQKSIEERLNAIESSWEDPNALPGKHSINNKNMELEKDALNELKGILSKSTIDVKELRDSIDKTINNNRTQGANSMHVNKFLPPKIEDLLKEIRDHFSPPKAKKENTSKKPSR